MPDYHKILWLPEHTKLPEKLAEMVWQYGIHPTFRQPESGFFLVYIQDKISLMQRGHKARIDVDFTTGKIAHRIRFGGKELLARAVNVRENRFVWDATAGMGQDAFVLAALGANVCLFERHPLVAALLADGLSRASEHVPSHDIAQRMSLYFGSFTDNLFRQPEYPQPQVVYLDPMFPERKKSAAVNQAMQYFQAAVGEDNDATEYLTQARKVAVKRVVFKRPKWAKALIDDVAYFYEGKNTRFDVYLPT